MHVSLEFFVLCHLMIATQVSVLNSTAETNGMLFRARFFVKFCLTSHGDPNSDKHHSVSFKALYERRKTGCELGIPYLIYNT